MKEMIKFRYALAEFLDKFYSSSNSERVKMVSKNPFPEFKDKRIQAYIAATVEELCYRYNLEIPEWVNDKKYFLKEPFFLTEIESIKPFLLVESPLSFKRRNIFVSSNVLVRV